MTRISNKLRFPVKEFPDLTDYFVGSDSQNSNATVNFEVGSVLNEAAGGGLPDEIIYGTYEWIEGTLSFNFFEIKYRKNGFLYTTDPVTLTLDNGNALPRKDIVAVTTNEEVVVVKGTPSADPAEPALPDYSIYLAFIVVDIAAFATVPTDASKELIYNEGVGEPTEWTPTENTGNTRIQLLATQNPSLGSNSIRFNNAIGGDKFTMTNDALIDVNLNDKIEFLLYLEEAIDRADGVVITFYNGNTVVSSSYKTTRGRYNYSNTAIGQYRFLSIPLSAFVFSASQYNKIEFKLARTTAYPLMYIDNIKKLNGLAAVLSGIYHSNLILNDGTNPHGTTKSDVGLGNVDNTSDINKPVSLAQQIALDLKLNIADLPTNVSAFVNDAGYLTTYSESDPVFTAWLSTPPNVSLFTNDAGYITSASISLQAALDNGDTATSPDTFSQVTFDLQNAGLGSINLIFDDNIGEYSNIYLDLGTVYLGAQSASNQYAEVYVGSGLLSFAQTNAGQTAYTSVEFLNPTAITTLNFPAKAAGTYTIATLDDIVGVVIDDTAYGISWNANLDGATKNAIYDKIQSIGLQAVTDIGATTTNNMEIIGENGKLLEVHNAGYTIGAFSSVNTNSSGSGCYTPTGDAWFSAGVTETSAIVKYQGVPDRQISMIATVSNAVIEFLTDASQSLTLQSTLSAGNFTQTFQAEDGTVALLSDIIDSYTKAESDGKYLLNTTDTLTGDLIVTGKVGINTAAPDTKLVINDVTKVLTNNVAGTEQGALSLVSTDAQAADIGAALAFGGRYIDASETRITYAAITGRKSNAASANADGYLSFYTWTTTGLTEKMRLHSSGNISIGNTNDTYKLDVSGTGNFTGDVIVPTEVYGVGWNGSNEVPTKDAIYDKIESLGAGSSEWATYTGTRLGGNLIVTIGDYDTLSGGTTLQLYNYGIGSSGDVLINDASLYVSHANPLNGITAENIAQTTGVTLQSKGSIGGYNVTKDYSIDIDGTISWQLGSGFYTNLIFPNATIDNNITFQDASGTVAFLSDIVGGGDVTKVGTPVDNQIGVWTGDGTLEGDSALNFSTATNALSVGINNTEVGRLIAYGSGTGGQPLGGALFLYTHADFDTSNDFYGIFSWEDDLRITDGNDIPLLEYKYAEANWLSHADFSMQNYILDFGANSNIVDTLGTGALQITGSSSVGLFGGVASVIVTPTGLEIDTANSGFAGIIKNTLLTVAAKNYELPNASGTIALTSDILVKGAVTVELYNGGSDLTTGIKDTPIRLPYNGTVTGWEIMAYDASNALLSTSCVVDILSDTFANLPLIGTDSIAGTEKPTLTATSTNSDNTITTWSALTEGNYIQAEIESVSAGTAKIVISIKVNRTS